MLVAKTVWIQASKKLCYVGVQSKKKGAFSAFNSKESSDNLPIEPAYEFLETSSWHKSDEKKKFLSDSAISCKRERDVEEEKVDSTIKLLD